MLVQGYRIWIFRLAVLPICRKPDAIMRLYSQIYYEYSHGFPLEPFHHKEKHFYMR